MEYRRLGRSALRVSPICLGTMNFGPLTTEADAHHIMDRALEHGINFFDTANRYGGEKGAGRTEEILGTWFAQGGDRREKVVLATKVFGPMTPWPNDGLLSARHIRDACEASLRRMQTDHIDLYQMHHIDRSAPWDEVWQAMETLVQQGKIVYVGSSNFAGWHIAQANEAAKARHFLGLVSEQSLYNLAARTVELEVLPAARFYGVGIIPWSPLAGGMLGGNPANGDTARRKSTQPRYERMRPQLERWEKLCADIGEEPAAVALAWLLHQKGVTAPIVGPRTLEQLEGASLHAIDREARRRDLEIDSTRSSPVRVVVRPRPTPGSNDDHGHLRSAVHDARDAAREARPDSARRASPDPRRGGPRANRRQHAELALHARRRSRRSRSKLAPLYQDALGKLWETFYKDRPRQRAPPSPTIPRASSSSASSARPNTSRITSRSTR